MLTYLWVVLHTPAKVEGQIKWKWQRLMTTEPVMDIYTEPTLHYFCYFCVVNILKVKSLKPWKGDKSDRPDYVYVGKSGEAEN